MVDFKYEEITPHIRRIRSTPDVCMYLVEGEKKAALIDTGNGVGDLKGYVEKLLNGKPYDVILTHGHVDHASGADQFGDNVYLNLLDYELSLTHCSIEHRKISFAHWREMFPDTMQEFADNEFVQVRQREYRPLEDGQLFDLGGITLEAIYVPGHTQGMTMVLDIEERVILFGDGCGVGVLLLTDEASTVSEYRDSLLKLKQHEDRYDRVLRQHGSCESPKSVLDDNIEVCNKILNGTADAVADIFEGIPCLLAMAVDPKTRKRIDGKEGNIRYTVDKIK
jgi:glyoxylase-like metal-dependent hydrolase (beta-lactamase superfamily II)